MTLRSASLLCIVLCFLARSAAADFPTRPVSATQIQGVAVPRPSGVGNVLTVGSGPSLTWTAPAAGVSLSNATPAGVSTSAGAAGAGTAAARSDHVHLLPIVPLSLGGFGQSLAGLLTTPTELGYLHNVTSAIQTQLNGKQATLTLPLSEANGGFGADLSGVGTGILVRSAANTPVVRSLTAPAAGIAITNPGGIAGSPTFALANDLAAVEGLAGTGIAVRTATDSWTNRALTAGTGITVTNGDGVSGNPTAAITATAVSAASYPTSGQIPTFTVNAQGQLTAAGSTTTLTSPAIASPTLSGSTTGTYTLAGTPTITAPIINGAVTGTITVPTPGAGTAQPATAAYAEAQKTGSVVVLGTASQTTGTWTANYYLGPYGIVEGALLGVTSTPVPACFSVAGTLKNFRLQAQVTNSPATNVTIYKTAAGAASYSATTAVIPVADNAQIGSDTTHSLAITAGDCVIDRTDTSWVNSGVVITAQFVPTT